VVAYVSPDDNYGSPLMVTRRIADGLRRKAAEYRKGDKPQKAEGCDEDADALEALLLDYRERGWALEAARGFVFDATLDDRYPDHAADVLNQIDATLKGKSHE